MEFMNLLFLKEEFNVFANNAIYEGTYKDGKKHGKGKLFSYDTCYVGEFMDDKMHGKGIIKFVNELFTYTGYFKENRFDGKGVMKYSNGAKYIGEFKDMVYTSVHIF